MYVSYCQLNVTNVNVFPEQQHNKSIGTIIYMKTQCLQTNEMQHYWKGKHLRNEGCSGEGVAIIKTLMYLR